MSGRTALREVVVDGEVPLACVDLGGDGPDVLLLHGAGRTLADLLPLAEQLSPAQRVVAVDLRGHGRSGDGDWSFTAALADVDRVVTDLGLQRPAVVGHSLGGMLAGMWAADRDCRAAVNLDGHGMGDPQTQPFLYPGLDAGVVLGRLAELATLQAAAAPAAAWDRAGVDALRAATTAGAAAFGVDAEVALAGLERALHHHPDGTATMRPAPATTAAVTASVERLDLLAVWRAARAPLLVVNATAPDPTAAQLPLPWFADLLACYRVGLSTALAELAAEHPLVTAVDLDADHALVLNRVADVAALVRSHLAAHP